MAPVIQLVSKSAWAPHVTDTPRSFASAPNEPVTRLIEPHRPARPVRRDVDVRLRVAARRSHPASAAHDLSRGGCPRPRRCAIPDVPSRGPSEVKLGTGSKTVRKELHSNSNGRCLLLVRPHQDGTPLSPGWESPHVGHPRDAPRHSAHFPGLLSRLGGCHPRVPPVA